MHTNIPVTENSEQRDQECSPTLLIVSDDPEIPDIEILQWTKSWFKKNVPDDVTEN